MAIRIRRREFIFTLGCTVTWSLVARAQQPYRMYQIGVLMDISQDDRVGQQYVSAFLHGLRELRWKDGASQDCPNSKITGCSRGDFLFKGTFTGDAVPAEVTSGVRSCGVNILFRQNISNCVGSTPSKRFVRHF